MSSTKREVIMDELNVSKGIKLGQDNCTLSRVNPFDIGNIRVASNKFVDGISNCLVFSFRQDDGTYDLLGHISSSQA